MKEELYKQVITLFLGGMLGVIFKYWYDYKAAVLKILWEKRYENYKKLLAITGILPLYPRPVKITYNELFAGSEKMRDWYFEEGGLLLSKKARDKYFDAQKQIRNILNGLPEEQWQKELHGEYSIVRELLSQLRTEMTNDLMSRTRLQGFFERGNSEPADELKTS